MINWNNYKSQVCEKNMKYYRTILLILIEPYPEMKHPDEKSP